MKRADKPSESELLAFLDEELTPERQAEIRQLLAANWELRAQLARLERQVEQYIEATAWLPADGTPTPDDLWQDFSGRLAQSTTTPNSLHLRQRWEALQFRWPNWWQEITQPRWRRWALSGSLSLLLLAIAAGVFFKTETTVSAQELLQRTVQAESSSLQRVGDPVVYRKIQIKRNDDVLFWESWNDAQRQQFRQRVSDQHGLRFVRAQEPATPTLLAEVAHILHTNHLDAQRPLSALAYAEWRKSVHPRFEQVTAITLPGNLPGWKLTTGLAPTAARDEILEASLLVRRSDWHAVALQLHVQGEQEVRRYELSEAAYEVLPLQALTIFTDVPSLLTPTPVVARSIAPSPTPEALSSPAPSNSPLPSEAQLQEAELATLYTLHQLRADLGEQIEVVREANRQIVVRGLVETEIRKAQLTNALAILPLVNARLQSVEEALQQTTQKSSSGPGIDTITLPAPDNTSSSRNAFEKRLAQYFQAQGETPPNAERKITELSNAVIANSSGALSDIWALRRLAERFPATREQELTAASRQQLTTMLRAHLTRLRHHTSELRGRLGPVLTTLANPSPATVSPVTEASWQAQVNTIFRMVERLRQSSGQAFTAAETAAPEQVARQLLETLLQLESTLETLSQQLNR